MKFGVALILAAAYAHCVDAENAFPSFSAPRAITKGPHEHLFASYYGVNAWSPDGRYVLALETDLNGRLPEPGERAKVGVVDLKNPGVFTAVAETTCWNFQEGTMAHWLPGEPDTFVYNDFRGGRFVAVVVDWKTRAERIVPWPVSAVSPDGTKAISINYARMRLTRPDYGYAGGGQDAREGVAFPEDDGLFLVDLKSGAAKLIVSIAQVRDRVPAVKRCPGKPGSPLSYFCHTVFSKDGSRVFWLSRSVDWYDKEKAEHPMWHTTAFTCDADGGNVRRCFPDGWGASHFNWKDDRTMVVTVWYRNGVWSHVEFTVGEEEKVRRLAPGLLDWDGHCLYTPDGRFMASDSDQHPSRSGLGERFVSLTRLEDGAVKSIGTFTFPEKYAGEHWRCDLHGRFRPDGGQFGFNSVHEGSRQLYVMDVRHGKAEAPSIWVDAAAREGGDGSAANPFNSVVTACDAACRMPRKAGETVTIRLRKGDYFFADGLVLNARDSHLRFIGEKGVRFTRAEKATPGGVVKCAAPQAPDVEWYGKIAPHAPMFFYDDTWAVEARWPNVGWTTFKKDQVVDSGLRGRCLAGIMPDDPTAAGSFRFDSDRPARWDWTQDDIRLCGYTTHDWCFERLRLRDFAPSNRLVRLAGAAPYGLGGDSWSEHAGRRFIVVGAKAELDAPGEYYYDRKTGKVDFIAPSGMKNFYAVTKEGPIVALRGTSDVTFEGIVFDYAVGNGLTLTDCTNVTVKGCFIWNVGGKGVVIERGARCRVEGTEIAAVGFDGVNVFAGDRRTLTRCGHVIENCDIHDFSRINRTYAPAVRVGGVGVTVRGCKIYDAPHAGVLYGGNDHLFESNEVCRILWESGDAGAFYTGRDPTSRGNVLRGNYVHDIGHPENGSRNTMAFYLDDCDAGDTIVSNRIVNVPRGIMLGGGHDNHLVGNTFERCNLAVSVDARGVVWNDRWDSPTDKSWQMTRKVKETPVDEEPWKSRYPLLANYLNDGPREPRHCSIVGNRFIGCGQVYEWGMRADEYKHLIAMRDNVEKPLSDTVAKLPAKPTLPKDELWTRKSALWASARGATLQAAAAKALADKPTVFPDDLYLEYWTNGNRSRFQNWKSRLCANLAILTAAESEEGQGRWIPGIEERLVAICDMKSWVHPAHDWGDGGKGAYNGTRLTVDLGCSDIGALLACVLQALDGKLDAKVRQRVVKTCWERIVKPLWREIPFHACQGGDSKLYDRIDHWWISAENNWNAVCWDNVLCTVLGLVESPAQRAYFVDAALKSMPLYIEGGFGADGYCSEGMGYWNYGFGHYLAMGLMLRKVSHGKIDIFTTPKQKRVAQYALSYRLAENMSPAFADGCGAPTEANLARVREVWPDLAQELPFETKFAASQVWLWRDPKGVSVAFKGGHNGELHNHNDIGSYWVMVGDRFVGGDPGSEVYTRRTFSDERYASKILNSYGHPVPVVGGRLQSEGSRFAAKIISATPGEVVLDLKGAYDVKVLKTLTRTFAYDRAKKTLTIRDEAEFSEPTDFESAFNTFFAKDNADLGKKSDPWAKRNELDLDTAWDVRPQVTAEGGAWKLAEETIPNPGRWSPHRVAVRFERPVKSAVVTFVYRERKP